MQDNNINITVATEFTLLGTWITDDLKWDVNVIFLIKLMEEFSCKLKQLV